MLVSEILQEVRNKLSDVLEPNLWDNTELLSYFKQAVSHIYLFSGYGRTTLQINTTASEPSYNIGLDILYAYIKDTALENITYETMNALLTNMASSGTPTKFASYNGILYLYPTPDDVYTVDLVGIPSANSLDFDTDFSFPDTKLLVYGTMLNAMEKNDIEVINPTLYNIIAQKYNTYMAQFKSNFVRDSNVYATTKILGGLL